MSTITFEDFQKLDLRVARIVKAEEIEGADYLLKLTLDVGDPLEETSTRIDRMSSAKGLGKRIVVAGIKKWYKTEDLVGKLIVYLANLKPKGLRGIKSQGMILAAFYGKPILIVCEEEVPPGTKIR